MGEGEAGKRIHPIIVGIWPTFFQYSVTKEWLYKTARKERWLIQRER